MSIAGITSIFLRYLSSGMRSHATLLVLPNKIGFQVFRIVISRKFSYIFNPIGPLFSG